jgi:hypothetical protein
LPFSPAGTGATIYKGAIRRDEPLRLVLPPAISVSGRVTVGGKDPARRPGVIHILAAYQGDPALSSALSIATTADADGHFVLSGVTSETYLVQAALDDIWLSSVAPLRAASVNIKPIHLAIPLPGSAVRPELRDRAGRPVVGRAVTMHRTGPLAYLWPHQLISDGAGSIYIPTLEAGKQTIHVNGESKPLKFHVPALATSPVVIPVRVTLVSVLSAIQK